MRVSILLASVAVCATVLFAQVRKIASSTVVTGTGVGLAIDSGGNLYVAEPFQSIVMKFPPIGKPTTIAGSGTPGFSGDGKGALDAQLDLSPRRGSLAVAEGIAVDDDGVVFIADGGNNRIRKVLPNGVISTVAGNGKMGFGGDGGPAVNAQLNYPRGVAVDNAGNLYIADTYNNRIRKVLSNGTIITVAGGREGVSDAGDGGAAIKAGLSNPEGIVVDKAGNLYISEGSHRIREVTTDGVIRTVAGTGVAGFGGDNGPATAAKLNFPQGVVLDSKGNLLIADQLNGRIRSVSEKRPIGGILRILF